ncbi:MAG: rod shape-determining protein MreD [Candidatus Limnocylindrales bacterium]
MQVALAVVGSIVAALLDTSVTPFASIGGVRPDIVLVTGVVVAVVIGSETGFVWAFAGGLTLDMLSAPARPVGSSVVALLIVTGLAALVARVAGRNQAATAIIVTFPLTYVYQFVFGLLVAAALGGVPPASPLQSALPTAIENTVLAVPCALVARWAWLRWGVHDRIEW